MTSDNYKKAKKLEDRIREIEMVIAGLEGKSFYQIQLIHCGDNASAKLAKILGHEYLQQVNKATINVLMLEKFKLEKEFTGLVA